MKAFLPLAIASALAMGAQAAEYTVFRVCEDQHVIRTSDGADGGRVEYIVVEPSSHRVVSTVITGGVLGERLVAMPVESFQMTEREITLTQIDRTRLVAAPVIERTHLTTRAFIQPTVIERSFTHFGARLDTSVSTESRTRTDVDVNTRDTTTERRGTRAEAERTTQAEADRAQQPGRTTTGTPPSTETNREGRVNRRDRNRPDAEAERTREQKNPPTTPGAGESKLPPATPSPQDKSGRTPSTPPPTSANEKSDRAPSTPPAGSARDKADQDKPQTDKTPGAREEAGKSEKKSGQPGDAAERAGEKSERPNRKAGDANEPRTDKSPGKDDKDDEIKKSSDELRRKNQL